MASGRDRLTAGAIDKRKDKGRMFDGAGLILNVTMTGSKNWIFRYTPKGGKVREMGLGGYPDVSLKKARNRANECRTLVADGLDPKSERDKEAGVTFGETADEYYKAMNSRWTNAKTRYKWKRTLQETCKPIRNTAVADIGTEQVLAILQPIWLMTPETASQVRGRIENVLYYAKAKGKRTGENPARWRGHLQNTLPARKKHTVKHHAAMPHKDVPAFVGQLHARREISSCALEFLILTAARTNEVLGAQWSEIDFDNELWTVPADRMKLRIDHEVPLSSRALEILTVLHEGRYNNYVFPGTKPGKPLSNMVMEMLLRRMKITDVTVHGFRSSFRDWCGDKTNFPREIAEHALAHKVGDDVERSYRRGAALEKRRQLMNAWADYCQGAVSDNVVSLHG